MKKIIICTFVLAVAIQGVQAQDAPQKKRESFHGRHHRSSANQLNLTEEQKSKFKSMNDDFRKQMQELRKKDDITVKEWRQKMETLRKDHRSHMQGMLTTEQKAQLDKQRSENRNRHRKDTEARMERMKTRLALTNEQSAQLKANRTEMMTKMKALRENQSLSQEKKKEQLKQLREEQNESLKKILTEEQLKNLPQKQTRRPAKQPM